MTDKKIISGEKLFIRRLKEGDNDAFDKLYHMYAEKLYYFALRFLRTKEDAEGLVQDTFIKIWENRENLKPQNSFNAFLFTIARNSIFNQNRKKLNERAYKVYLKEYLDKVHNKTENDVILAETQQKIQKVIATLPPQRKLIFQMSREKGLSYKEISKELNISVKTVEAHMRLALKQVRAEFKDEIPLSSILHVFLLLGV